MAQNNILVYNFNQLKSIAQRISLVYSALNDVKSINKNLSVNAGEYWSGQAYEAFKGRMEAADKSLDVLYEQIKSSKEKLDKAIQLEEENENDLTNKTVGGLSASEIF